MTLPEDGVFPRYKIWSLRIHQLSICWRTSTLMLVCFIILAWSWLFELLLGRNHLINVFIVLFYLNMKIMMNIWLDLKCSSAVPVIFNYFYYFNYSHHSLLNFFVLINHLHTLVNNLDCDETIKIEENPE